MRLSYLIVAAFAVILVSAKPDKGKEKAKDKAKGRADNPGPSNSGQSNSNEYYIALAQEDLDQILLTNEYRNASSSNAGVREELAVPGMAAKMMERIRTRGVAEKGKRRSQKACLGIPAKDPGSLKILAIDSLGMRDGMRSTTILPKTQIGQARSCGSLQRGAASVVRSRWIGGWGNLNISGGPSR